jgi:thioredoxin-like negative regulator of GroEL
VVTETAARFGIRSIPTLAVVFGGRELGRVTGVRPASEIETFAERTVAAATPRAS